MDKPLPDGKGALLDRYDAKAFTKDAIARFPTLRDELERDGDLLHVQMSTLAAAVHSASDGGDHDLALDICRFLEERLSSPKIVSELENAAAISFVETRLLRKTERGRRLLEEMPPQLKALLAEQESRDGG